MRALILMTRIPIPGRTKTRLMDILTGEGCADIHKAFLLDLFNIFNIIKDDIDIYLTYTPEKSIHLLDEMIPDYIETFPQKGETLGERMTNAIDYVLDKGYESTILIGSDIPDIRAHELIDAFQKLEDNDICIGPTFDGGYYLIGMKELHRKIFSDNLKWGNKSVLEGTIDIANNHNLRVGLAAKHRDIDTKEDIRYFKKRIDRGDFNYTEAPRNTIEYINRCWGEVHNAKRHIKG